MQHGRRQRGDSLTGWGAATPCAICPAPQLSPSRREENYMCPLDPSRPLSQRTVYVKIHEMCQNTAQSVLNFFYFRSLTAKAATCC